MSEDPWRQLAIESQARQVLPGHPESSPAILMLLREASEEAERIKGPMGAILDYEVQRLTDHLMAGTFAREIVKAVWGPEARVVDFMKDTTEMEALVNDVISNSAAQWGKRRASAICRGRATVSQRG